jgi:hypothetical protein
MSASCSYQWYEHLLALPLGMINVLAEIYVLHSNHALSITFQALQGCTVAVPDCAHARSRKDTSTAYASKVHAFSPSVLCNA